jgi:hypothetical protein
MGAGPGEQQREYCLHAMDFPRSTAVEATPVGGRAAGLLLAAWLCASLAGCARWNLSDRFAWPQDREAATADQIVPMWSDTVLYESGKPGVRGFGARIYFYDRDAQQPVKVDGALVVYAFDASDGLDMPVPEKKYVFPAEQFAKHYSKTNLGHSYSVWLPWDTVGGPTRHVSLVTRFEGTDGSVVVSEPARKLLPGVNQEPDGQLTTAGSANVKASYSAKELENGIPGSITIDVPPSFSRKLRRSAAAPTEPSYVDVQPAAPASPSSALAPAREAPDAQLTAEEAAEGERLAYHQRLQAHFERSRPQAQNLRAARQAGDPLRKQPHRGEWLSGLPATPRSDVSTRTTAD